jgi:hypothetical protein
MKSTIVEKVQKQAKKIAKRETQRFPEAAAAGDAVRQGDVYITLLADAPAGYVRRKKWDRQLAPGETQGSRHIIDSTAGVVCYLNPHATEFDGPVLQIKQEREITHPEHGNWILPPGVYGISYQRTQDALDQQRRVAD